MKRVAIYARYSSENQRNGNSIEGQIDVCTNYANRQGWNIVETYIDEAKTAKQVAGRADFNRLLQDGMDKQFDILLVDDLDRFARNIKDHFSLKELIVEQMGLRLVSVNQHLDESPESFINETVHAMMNHYYVLKLAKATIRGLNVNAKKGKFNGGITPLGYYIGEHGQYLIDENERPIVQMIFDLYVSGVGYLAICNHLNALGFKTRKGREFGKNSIYEILRNKKYIGLYEFNKAPKKSKSGKWNNHKRRDEAEIIKVENAVPQIITIEQFEKVQEKLKSRERNSKPSGEVYLLRSLITCGKCGNILLAHRSTSKNKAVYFGYCCSNKSRSKSCNLRTVQRKTIEDEVLLFLRELYTDETKANIYEFIGNRLKGLNDTNERRMKALRDEIKKNERQIELFIENFQGQSKSVNKKIFELEAVNERLENEIENLKPTKETIKEITPQMIAKELDELNGLDEKPREEQRRIINKYIKKIVINETDNDFCVGIHSHLDKFCPSVCDKMVAGAGFEPTTFGL